MDLQIVNNFDYSINIRNFVYLSIQQFRWKSDSKLLIMIKHQTSCLANFVTVIFYHDLTSKINDRFNIDDDLKISERSYYQFLFPLFVKKLLLYSIPPCSTPFFIKSLKDGGNFDHVIKQNLILKTLIYHNT